MHRTRWSRSKDERHEAGVAPRGAAAAGPSSRPAQEGLTPAEIHAQQRSATLTAAQSRRRGVLPG